MTPPAVKDRPVLVTEEMIVGRDWRRRQMPAYKVSEVAKVFFGMSASWIRLHLSKGVDRPKPGKKVRPPGVLYEMDFRRLDPHSLVSARLFLLSDIQPMAEVLFKHGKITAQHLARILTVISAQAELYGLYDDPGAVTAEPAQVD